MIQQFDFKTTSISGLIDITPFDAFDLRGCFTKDYSREVFAEHGIEHDLKEVFYTTSHKGVIRGLHFQRVRQQPKLVRCIHGHVFDVVVDLRVNSPSFKKWIGFELTGENHKEILVPSGCAHGYLVIEESVVSYKCAERFILEYDDGIYWNDNDIGIEWPLEEVGGIDNIILSEKDAQLQDFQSFLSNNSIDG